MGTSASTLLASAAGEACESEKRNEGLKCPTQHCRLKEVKQGRCHSHFTLSAEQVEQDRIHSGTMLKINLHTLGRMCMHTHTLASTCNSAQLQNSTQELCGIYKLCDATQIDLNPKAHIVLVHLSIKRVSKSSWFGISVLLNSNVSFKARKKSQREESTLKRHKNRKCEYVVYVAHNGQ